MKKVQRLGGKMLKRSADEADVGAVINEFKNMDERLDQLLKDVKKWRDSWEDVLKFQYDASEAFVTLYKPIEPTKDPEMRHVPTETPQKYMQKCLALQKLYSDVKADLAQEIGMITTKVVRPVEEAKKNTKTLQKTLKHRDNTKLDYARYLGRVEHIRKKDSRSPKEDATLAKHEDDLAQARIDYQTADDQVKQTFPPMCDAILALVPSLMASQVVLQTTLVGQLYTCLEAYCRQQGFPLPAPSDAAIIAKWNSEFTPFRQEIESGITLIANGRAPNLSMNIQEKESGSLTGLGIRDKVMQRGKSNQSVPTKPVMGGRVSSSGASIASATELEAAPPKPPRPGAMPSPAMPSPAMSSPAMPSPAIPSPSGLSHAVPTSAALNRISSYNSTTSGGLSHPIPTVTGLHRIPSYNSTFNNAPYDQKPTALTPHYPNHQPPAWLDNQSSGGNTPPSRYGTPPGRASPSPSAASNRSGDYFLNQDRRSSAQSLASSAAGALAAKKKPAPPVPAKRVPSAQAQYVTALFDFEGQNPGDLAFREGDRIKVMKKTDSTEDWWDGELRGKVGAFPANYVQV